MARKLLKLTTHNDNATWGSPREEVPFYIFTYAVVAFHGSSMSWSVDRLDGEGNPVYQHGDKLRDDHTHYGSQIIFADEHNGKHSQFVLETPEAVAELILASENG